MDESVVNQAWEQRSDFNPNSYASSLRYVLKNTIEKLDTGVLRVATCQSQGKWQVHQWLKKAILLTMRLEKNVLIPLLDNDLNGNSESVFTKFYDKLPSKFAKYSEEDFENQRARVVPPAMVRKGSFIGQNVILMPSYVNIGAYIDTGCMIDTWATVGSCAQIGKNVHISGGVGIGGVLEPLQDNPVIIEDNCFIGARSEIVEGVIVEENSVISMGVYIGQSTRIYNRLTGKTITGRVPAGSVVVPGSLPATNGEYNLYAAIIVKTVDAKTRAKTSLNDLLRC